MPINDTEDMQRIGLALQVAWQKVYGCQWPRMLQEKFCQQMRRSVPGGFFQCQKCGRCFDLVGECHDS